MRAATALTVGVFALYHALRQAMAALVATFVSLAPLVTVAAETALLDLVLEPVHWGGLLLVLGGAVALAWSGSPARKRPGGDHPSAPGGAAHAHSGSGRQPR